MEIFLMQDGNLIDECHDYSCMKFLKYQILS